MNKAPSADGLGLGIALLRVSTDKQFQDGESIETQRRKVELVARRERIDIVRYFVEHYSGRKSDRRTLDEMFAFLGENPDVNATIVSDIDRLTRGGSEVYLELRRRLYALKVRLIDTTGIIQPERNRLEHLGVEYAWSVESPSHYAEVFMAEKARAEASDILTRTIGQQIQLTRDGYQCRGSNYGYRNIKITTLDGKKKTTLVADEIEGPLVQRMFELRAGKPMSDEDICAAINAMGYRSRVMNVYDRETRQVIGKTGGVQLTPKQLQKYLSRSIYCGIRAEGWNGDTPVRAPIDPLVSVKLFNKANRGKVQVIEQRDGTIKIVEDREPHEQHRHNPDFLLRHVIVCDHCGKPFVASKSTGKAETIRINQLDVCRLGLGLHEALADIRIHNCGAAFVPDGTNGVCYSCGGAWVVQATEPALTLTDPATGQVVRIALPDGAFIYLGRDTIPWASAYVSARHLLILRQGNSLYMAHKGSNPTLITFAGEAQRRRLLEYRTDINAPEISRAALTLADTDMNFEIG